MSRRRKKRDALFGIYQKHRSSWGFKSLLDYSQEVRTVGEASSKDNGLQRESGVRECMTTDANIRYRARRTCTSCALTKLLISAITGSVDEEKNFSASTLRGLNVKGEHQYMHQYAMTYSYPLITIFPLDMPSSSWVNARSPKLTSQLSELDLKSRFPKD